MEINVKYMTRYKSILKEKGVKMSWVAEKINVPNSTLSNYISGKRKIPLDVEIKLNKLLSN